MISISNNLKLAQESISRTVDAYVLVNGVRYNTDKLVKFTFEDNIMPDGGFTIGNTTSNNTSIEIIEEEGVINAGDTIEPYLGIKVNDSFEYVSLGKFIVGELSHKGKVVNFKAFDKLYYAVGEYETTITTFPTTTNLVLQDICTQLGLQLVNTGLEDISIPDKMQGYKVREVLGVIAGLYGYNARISRDGKLEFVTYSTNKININPDTYFTSVKSTPVKITGLSNYFGDFANTVGDNTGSVVVTSNPYMNATTMNAIFDKIKVLNYSSCDELKYRGFLNLQAGDIVELLDVRDNVCDIYVTSHVLEFTGGLSGTIKSAGTGKTDNEYMESKIKNKKNLTEIKVELGLIQATVKEYDNKIDEKGNELLQELYSQLQITKDSILTEVSETYYSGEDADELEKRIMSNVTQTASDITTTFTEITTKLDDNLNEYKEEVSTIIREDANGISIGKSDSEIGMNLSNSKLSFTQGDDEIAYLSNKKLMITDAEVKNSLQIGSYQFIPQENGNMSMVWVK